MNRSYHLGQDYSNFLLNIKEKGCTSQIKVLPSFMTRNMCFMKHKQE